MKSERQQRQERMAKVLAETNGAIADQPGAPSVAPRDERANEGSDDLSVWCPKCQERAIPMRDGTCGFCNTVLVDPPAAEPTAPPPTEPTEPTEPTAPSRPRPDESDAVLRLGDDLCVPLDAATQSLAILAVKGAGKTNTAAVLAEEFYDQGLPWVVIDPKGDWWGLRDSPDTPGSGLPIPVLGGLHGDAPLTTGAHIARLIVEQNLTCVLDVSELLSDERGEFLAEFAQQLFSLHAHQPQPRHLFLEEADEIVPQRGGKEMRDCVKAWSRMVRQGRQRGLGITLISQRSALVHKDVLTQTGTLVILRTTSPQDRKAIAGWVDYHSVAGELVDSLPSLHAGQAWVCSPEWLGRVDRVQIRRRWTFDSGATPVVVAKRQRVGTLADVDLEQLRDADRWNRGGEPDDDPAPAATVTRKGHVRRSPSQHQEAVLEQLHRGPATVTQLAAAAEISGFTTRQALHALRDRGLAGPTEETARTGGAPAVLWAASGQEPDEDPAPAADGGRVAAARAELEAALRELDRTLAEPGEAGITLLQARYLAALLARIEGGDQDPDLLDRFERVAGMDADELTPTRNPSPPDAPEPTQPRRS